MKVFKNTYTWFRGLTLRRKIAVTSGVVAVILVLIPLLTYAYFARDIANKERLMNRKDTGVVLVDRHGEEFYRAYGAESSDNKDISLEKMPDHVPQALIATEDREFYDHGGYSVKAMLAALYGNILQKDLKHYGGSTITQQLAKNALLSNRKTYLRKYQELSLAIAIERYYSKDEILEMYLNSVYFGEGAFGIEDAANTYFNKPAQKLTPAESSLLIGILPGPSAMSPISGDKEAAEERQETVLTSMEEAGHITSEEKTAYLNQDLQFQQPPEERDSFAQHYANMAIDELKERYGEEKITRSGFRVATTLDISWQKQAHESVQSQIERMEYANASNGSLVAIDPRDGTIRALVGSADWENDEFGKVNMATTPRQPGSSFKPIYYVEALRQKQVTPVTIIRDEPTTFGTDYQPENFDFAYRGDVTVRDALAQSLNIPSVKVMEELGVAEAVDTAQKLGLEEVDDPDTYGLSLALGTAEVKLLNLTNAYAAFANQGTQFEPTTIQEIDNKYGETIHTHEPRGEEVMEEGASFLISSILSDDAARAPTFGGSLTIDRPAAVKTGTTEDSRDALTVGYTPNIVVGVWVGNNSNEPMEGIGGSSGAGPIWREAMQTFLADLESADFQKPESVEAVLLCRSNYLPAERPFEGTYTEHFLRGTVPSGKCEAPDPEDEEEDEDEDNQDDTEQDESTQEDDQEEETEDTQAPTAPTGLTAESQSSSEIKLDWDASSDNKGVAGYKIYYSDTDKEIGDVSGTSFTDSDLKPETEYSYYVKAYDEAVNISDPSNTVSETTDKEQTDDTGDTTDILNSESAGFVSVRMRV